MENLSDEAVISGEDLRQYVEVNMESAFIPVAWCPSCKKKRGEAEMVKDKAACIHCCS